MYEGSRKLCLYINVVSFLTSKVKLHCRYMISLILQTDFIPLQRDSLRVIKLLFSIVSVYASMINYNSERLKFIIENKILSSKSSWISITFEFLNFWIQQHTLPKARKFQLFLNFLGFEFNKTLFFKSSWISIIFEFLNSRHYLLKARGFHLFLNVWIFESNKTLFQKLVNFNYFWIFEFNKRLSSKSSWISITFGFSNCWIQDTLFQKLVNFNYFWIFEFSNLKARESENSIILYNLWNRNRNKNLQEINVYLYHFQYFYFIYLS